MKKITILLLLSSLFSLLVLSACGVLQEPEKASGPIEALPLNTQTSVVEGQSGSASPEEGSPAALVSGTTFTIDPSNSSVRFELDEDLRGVRTTVVGVTDQIAGELSVDLSALNNAQIGVIQINARTLATDNNMRNRTIQNEILDTRSYEYITFAPSGIQGLPDRAVIGEEISFTISGDLTVRDITQPVQFNVKAKAVTDTQIVGTASVIINRSDFGLRIPSVPNVANVEEEVELTIDFTANAS